MSQGEFMVFICYAIAIAVELLFLHRAVNRMERRLQERNEALGRVLAQTAAVRPLRAIDGSRKGSRT